MYDTNNTNVAHFLVIQLATLLVHAAMFDTSSLCRSCLAWIYCNNDIIFYPLNDCMKTCMGKTGFLLKLLAFAVKAWQRQDACFCIDIFHWQIISLLM